MLMNREISFNVILVLVSLVIGRLSLTSNMQDLVPGIFVFFFVFQDLEYSDMYIPIWYNIWRGVKFQFMMLLCLSKYVVYSLFCLVLAYKLFYFLVYVTCFLAFFGIVSNMPRIHNYPCKTSYLGRRPSLKRKGVLIWPLSVRLKGMLIWFLEQPWAYSLHMLMTFCILITSTSLLTCKTQRFTGDSIFF